MHGSTRGFLILTDEEMSNMLDNADSANTKRQIKYVSKVFTDFLMEMKVEHIEHLGQDIKLLDSLLCKFYAGARNRNGDLYSQKSMQAFRYGLQRNLLSSHELDIVKGKAFSKSERVFKSVISQLKYEGKANVKHHTPVSTADPRSKKVSTQKHPKDCSTKCLWISSSIFANRGMEDIRDLTTNDFILNEVDGRHYFSIVDKLTKNHRDDDSTSQGGRMFEIPTNPSCPVESMLKYKAKLNPKCSWFWQKPNKVQQINVWYDNFPSGKNTLRKMMKIISQNANCSTPYTNHCLRALSVTI